MTPANPRPLHLRSADGSAPPRREAAGAKILIVDDEAAILTALERVLTGAGYRVRGAPSADVAMDILATERMDVVISDESMPGQQGSEFIAEVRERYPATLRIMLSGRASLDSAVRAINQGEVYRFLLKPCNAEDLKIAIRQGLEHRRLLEQNRWLLLEYKRQAEALQAMDVTARVMHLKTDDDGAIFLDDSEEAEGPEVDELISQIERELFSSKY